MHMGRGDSTEESEGVGTMYDPLKAKAKVVLYSVIAFTMGLGLASGFGWTDVSHAMPVIDERPQVLPAAVKPARDLSDAFVSLADAVTPAVVRLETRRPVRAARGFDGGGQVPDAFRQFFDGQEDGREPAPQQGQISGGSGFIFSEDGYILTNNHVVEGADEVRVYLSDRRYFIADVIGADPYTDVAVVKIDAGERLPAMSFGDSDEVRVGEWVVAIGNPGFGASTQLDYTVTAGIISARGRGLRLLQRDLQTRFGSEAAAFAIEDFIQTDAVINPGNSGGPMVNLDGQVVGINSAIASSTGFYQGYGFAIPINLARRVMQDLVEFGSVRRPLIGVRIVDVAAEDAEAYGLPTVSGVLVQDVTDGGPAVGVLQGEDVIVALDGEPVGYVAELQAKIAERHPGDRVELSVFRDGRARTMTLRLDEAPINEERTVLMADTDLAEERLGLNVEPITAEVAAQLDLPSTEGGVLIARVARGSAADRRGLGAYEGWKLTRINDTPISTTQDVREALDRVSAGEIVSVHVLDPRVDDSRVINVRMPR